MRKNRRFQGRWQSTYCAHLCFIVRPVLLAELDVVREFRQQLIAGWIDGICVER